MSTRLLPADIDTLSAGHEMDALVAEHIMGWERQGSGWNVNGSISWPDPEGNTTPLAWVKDFPFSSDIAAAWQVVEKLILDNKLFELEFYQESVDSRPRWGAAFGIESYADTAPLAVCRAALKAVL